MPWAVPAAAQVTQLYLWSCSTHSRSLEGINPSLCSALIAGELLGAAALRHCSILLQLLQARKAGASFSMETGAAQHSDPHPTGAEMFAHEFPIRHLAAGFGKGLHHKAGK